MGLNQGKLVFIVGTVPLPELFLRGHPPPPQFPLLKNRSTVITGRKRIPHPDPSVNVF